MGFVVLFCFDHDESIKHLFFDCLKTERIWRGIQSWLGIRGDVSLRGGAHLKAFGVCGDSKRMRRVKFLVWIAGVWGIWCHRNTIVFRGAVFNEWNVIWKIKALSWRWFISRSGRESGCNIQDWWDKPCECLEKI